MDTRKPSEKQAPPVAKPAGAVTWTKSMYGVIYRYVDGKCVQGWRTHGGELKGGPRLPDETDITYAEALKNPGVMRDYPPPVEPQPVQDSELASLKSELEDYKMLVRSLADGDAWFGNKRIDGIYVYTPDQRMDPNAIADRFEWNGDGPMPEALRSALKAAVEGGKA